MENKNFYRRFFKLMNIYFYIFNALVVFVTLIGYVSGSIKIKHLLIIILIIIIITITIRLIFKRFSNKVVEIKFDDHNISFITLYDKEIIIPKSDCTSIRETTFNNYIFEFKSHNKLVCQKFWGFSGKPIMDFSIINNINFPNAYIKLIK